MLGVLGRRGLDYANSKLYSVDRESTGGGRWVIRGYNAMTGAADAPVVIADVEGDYDVALSGAAIADNLLYSILREAADTDTDAVATRDLTSGAVVSTLFPRDSFWGSGSEASVDVLRERQLGQTCITPNISNGVRRIWVGGTTSGSGADMPSRFLCYSFRNGRWQRNSSGDAAIPDNQDELSQPISAWHNG